MLMFQREAPESNKINTRTRFTTRFKTLNHLEYIVASGSIAANIHWSWSRRHSYYHVRKSITKATNKNPVRVSRARVCDK